MRVSCNEENRFFMVDVCMYVCVGVKSTVPDKAPASNNGSSINQLLGIKGASQETVSHKLWTLFWCYGYTRLVLGNGLKPVHFYTSQSQHTYSSKKRTEIFKYTVA